MVAQNSKITNNKVYKEERKVNRAEIIEILENPSPEIIERAYQLRKQTHGKKVSVQILSNARSGDCSQDCAYCAQSHKAETGIDRYKMIAKEKLLEDGNIIKEKGLARHCIGLSGIRFQDKEIEEFAGYIKELKQQNDTSICCSIGFLTKPQAIKLKEAGVNRINHNLNTSEKYYEEICSTHTWRERFDNIKMLQDLGFEICSGGIIGLGEKKEDIADLLLSFQEIKPNSIPINFLIPIEGTRKEKNDVSHLTPEYCLTVLALTRILNPTSDIRAAAGREIYLKGHEAELFKVVDSIFASGYLTTKGAGIDETKQLIEATGYECIVE